MPPKKIRINTKKAKARALAKKGLNKVEKVQTKSMIKSAIKAEQRSQIL